MPMEQTAVRTWMRDGSTNEMPLGIAALNLKHNGVCSVEVAKERLLQGETLMTKHATFKLAPLGDGYHAPTQQEAGRVNPHNGHPSILPSQEALLGV